MGLAELSPESIVLIIHAIAVVWGASKLHSAVENLKDWKQDVQDWQNETESDIAEIDIRLSLVEQKINLEETDDGAFSVEPDQ